MSEIFDHVIHRYGAPGHGSTLRLDHELEVGEIIEMEGQPMRVVAARSDDRKDERVRIVHVESVTGRPPP